MWIKLGNIFRKKAQLPTVQIVKNKIRVFYSHRYKNISYINYFESDLQNPSKIIYENKNPILSSGKNGCFDDCGVMPSCVFEIDGQDCLYYTGWNTCKGNVPYGHGIGMVFIDDLKKIKRTSSGPILDRTLKTPFLVNSPYVYKNKKFFEMIFCNGNGWKKNFATYHLSKAISLDGKSWDVKKDVFFLKNKAISRPCVFNDCIWSSIKEINTNYKIYLIRDNKIVEEKFVYYGESLWDSEMMCYPTVFEVEKQRYMYYNGNNYGETGIGLAKWV